MVALGALYALTFAQVNLGAQGRATIEAAGGTTPTPTQTATQSDHEYAISTAVIPSIQLRAATPRTQSTLLYSSRIFLRAPSYGLGIRPLVLHTVRADETLRLSPQATWLIGGFWSRGETDYWGLAQALTRTQTSLPAVVGLEQLSLQTSLTYTLSTLWDLGISAQADRLSPLTVSTEPVEPPAMPDPSTTVLNLTRSERIVGSGFLQRGLSATEAVRGIGTVAYETLGDRLDVLTVSPALGWSYAPTLETSYAASAGASFVRTDDRGLSSDKASAPQRKNSVSPSADLSLRQRIAIVTRTIFAAEAAAGIQSYLDPFIGSVSPVGTARVRVGFTTPLRWSGAVEISFATNLGERPENNRTDTMLGVQVPFSYRPTPGIDVGFGFRMIQRGPHLKTEGFSFVQHDIGVYGSLSAWFDLNPGGGAVPTRTTPGRSR